jgi:DNA-binding transcriptional ArsR family regulator
MKRFEALKKEFEDLKRKLEEPQAREVPPSIEEPPKPSTFSGRPSIEKMLMDEVKSIVREGTIEIGGKMFEMSRLVDIIDPEEVERLLKVLASVDRIQILKFLFLEGKYFSQLQELTGLGPSPLNFHLNQLREVGLVDQEQTRGRYIATLKGRVTLSLLSYLVRKVSDKEW